MIPELTPEVRIYLLERANEDSKKQIADFKLEVRAKLQEIEDKQDSIQRLVIATLSSIIVGMVIAIITVVLGGIG